MLSAAFILAAMGTLLAPPILSRFAVQGPSSCCYLRAQQGAPASDMSGLLLRTLSTAKCRL